MRLNSIRCVNHNIIWLVLLSNIIKIYVNGSSNWTSIKCILKWKKRNIKIITWYIFISDLTNLVELDLSYNFLSSIPVGALADLNNLKFLNLGSNKIQVKFISKLETHLHFVIISLLAISSNIEKLHYLLSNENCIHVSNTIADTLIS